jgi:hypothetical protein
MGNLKIILLERGLNIYIVPNDNRTGLAARKKRAIARVCEKSDIPRACFLNRCYSPNLYSFIPDYPATDQTTQF